MSTEVAQQQVISSSNGGGDHKVKYAADHLKPSIHLLIKASGVPRKTNDMTDYIANLSVQLIENILTPAITMAYNERVFTISAPMIQQLVERAMPPGVVVYHDSYSSKLKKQRSYPSPRKPSVKRQKTSPSQEKKEEEEVLSDVPVSSDTVSTTLTVTGEASMSSTNGVSADAVSFVPM